MIKYFAIENFRSIKDEKILEFDLQKDKSSPFVASPVIGITGPNASGKTCLLQALTFVLWFIKDSFLHIEESAFITYEFFWSMRNSPTKFLRYS